jgi:hypothetical protein
MCLALYVGANHPLPLLPWHDDKNNFHVEDVSDEEKLIINHFSLKYVRYAGTEEGCGCLFNYGREYPEYQNEPDEKSAAERSRLKLVEYLKSNKVQEMYSCWEGDFNKPPKTNRIIRPEDILKEEFIFQEQQLITIQYEP